MSAIIAQVLPFLSQVGFKPYLSYLFLKAFFKRTEFNLGNFINPKIVLFSMKISPYFNEENFLNISPGYDMRLTWIFAQEHQQQVATAVERAKQVTMTDLNSVVSGGVSYFFSNVKKIEKFSIHFL